MSKKPITSGTVTIKAGIISSLNKRIESLEAAHIPPAGTINVPLSEMDKLINELQQAREQLTTLKKNRTSRVGLEATIERVSEFPDEWRMDVEMLRLASEHPDDENDEMARLLEGCADELDKALTQQEQDND